MRPAVLSYLIFYQLLFFNMKFSLVTLVFFFIFEAAVMFSYITGWPAKTFLLFFPVLSGIQLPWKLMQ